MAKVWVVELFVHIGSKFNVGPSPRNGKQAEDCEGKNDAVNRNKNPTFKTDAQEQTALVNDDGCLVGDYLQGARGWVYLFSPHFFLSSSISTRDTCPTWFNINEPGFKPFWYIPGRASNHRTLYRRWAPNDSSFVSACRRGYRVNFLLALLFLISLL